MFVAWSFVPPAVMTTLSERPVSCNPRHEFTNVFDAPESKITCVMACSIALVSSCIAAFITFRHSICRAQRSADVDVGLGQEWVIKRDSLGLGGGSSPVAAR